MEQTLGKQKQGTHRHCFAVSNHSSTRTSRCFYTILCRYRIAVLVRFGTCMSHWEGATFAEPHIRFSLGRISTTSIIGEPLRGSPAYLNSNHLSFAQYLHTIFLSVCKALIWVCSLVSTVRLLQAGWLLMPEASLAKVKVEIAYIGHAILHWESMTSKKPVETLSWSMCSHQNYFQF